MLIKNNTIDNKTVQRFGKNMKKICEVKEMSQGNIYRATKIERAYIGNVENGKQNLTISTMEKIAKALSVKIDQLLK